MVAEQRDATGDTIAPCQAGGCGVQGIIWLLPLTFMLGAACAWLLARSHVRAQAEAAERRIASLMYRSDRLAGEKLVLLDKLERHGEDLAAIKQQLLARERTLFAITGTWPTKAFSRAREREHG